MDDICRIKEQMIGQLTTACCNLERADTKELGEVADIIKDLAEAEYYCKVVEAMNEGAEDPYSGMYGYRPFVSQQPYIRDYLGMERRGMSMGDRMGYDPNMDSMWNDRSVKGYHPDEFTDPQYGKAYREYELSRKHFTKTGDANDKVEMTKHMNEHVRDTITTLRQMWKEADPEMRKHLKTDLQSLLDTMKE